MPPTALAWRTQATSTVALTNSTQGVFEDRIAALEGGVAGLAVASGAAAITLTHCRRLPRLATTSWRRRPSTAAPSTSWSTRISQFGVETTFVDAHNLTEVEGAIKENTNAIYLETLGNPNSDIPNIDAISEIAKKHGLPVVVDNTFGTPYLFRPLEHGANIVVHSATKFIGGHGSSLGGVIVDGGNFDWKASGKYAPIAAPNPSYHGVCFRGCRRSCRLRNLHSRYPAARRRRHGISPFNAWILLQGTETLSLRVDRHVENTKKVVEYLAEQPPCCQGEPPQPARPSRPRAVRAATSPTEELPSSRSKSKAAKEAAWKFIDNLQIFSLAGKRGRR